MVDADEFESCSVIQARLCEDLSDIRGKCMLESPSRQKSIVLSLNCQFGVTDQERALCKATLQLDCARHRVFDEVGDVVRDVVRLAQRPCAL